MPTYTLSSPPVSEDPLSNGGDFEVLSGFGVSTDENGVIGSSNAGFNISNLSSSVGTWGRVGYARITIGTLSNTVGVALLNTSGIASESAGVTARITSSTTVLIRERTNASNFNFYVTLADVTVPTLSPSDTVAIEVTDNVAADTQNWFLYVNGVIPAGGSGTFTYKDATTSGMQPSLLAVDAGASGITAMYASDAFSVPLEIDTDPASIERGTEFSISVSNASSDSLVVGAFSATLGGEAVNITSFTNDTGNAYTLGITVPLDVNLKHNATGYPLVITEDGVDATSAGNIPFTPQSGFSYINLVDPDFTDDTVFDLGGDAPVTGDQVVYTTTTTPNSKDFSVTAKGYGVIDYGEDEVTAESVELYIILNDGTYVSPIRTLEFNLTTAVGGVGFSGLHIPLHRKLLKGLKRPLQRKLH